MPGAYKLIEHTNKYKILHVNKLTIIVGFWNSNYEMNIPYYVQINRDMWRKHKG